MGAAKWEVFFDALWAWRCCLGRMSKITGIVSIFIAAYGVEALSIDVMRRRFSYNTQFAARKLRR
ncbi:hypothetical protein [Oceanicoccus sp. KOV_DT_Chl]|uniref:hypothetical protein n=1 Tax=Oceanicoccus sp. KOV_DT_Chl TaxID=1904639 RepID=UPI000C7DBE10|nr:hypothetical protein [Oceanicoccus sp. KOV_DT_Chl]